MKNKYSPLAIPFYLSLLSLLLVFSPAHAEQAQQLSPPQQVIHTTSEHLRQSLQSEALQQDFSQANRVVKEVFDPHIDFNRISALVLGKYWKRASKDEKAQFKQEFRELLIRTYATALTEFQNWDVKYLPLRMAADDKKVIVKTQVLQAGKPAVAVNYRMAFRKEKWKVYDVIVEGISLVTNYRSSFQNEIKQSGSLSSVIQQLVNRNNKSNS